MTRVGRYANPATTLDMWPDELPPGTTTEAVALATPDRSATTGTLYTPAARPRSLVAVMHPRVDFTRHYLIPPLLRAGHAVWAQRSRNVGNDLTTVHEQLLIDMATAHVELERRGFERIHVLGNSGGASLYCLYLQQAALAPEDRVVAAPSGLPCDLTIDMPMPAGLILLAPHPGQGDLLLHCIDPAVADEDDPASVVPALDLFDPANGFRPPQESSSYDEEFLARYRDAQGERVLRIDVRMRELLAEQALCRERGREGDTKARRRALAGTFVTVHRTDADPRTVDLSLDPSDRDYGSIFGRRPDVTNFGAVGFARLTTPHAWLSTWSGKSSRAALRLTAPDIDLPTLLVAYSADNSVFPGDVRSIQEALASEDIERIDVVGDHYGFAPGGERRLPDAADAITAWLEQHSN
jgi:hypothetical protein